MNASLVLTVGEIAHRVKGRVTGDADRIVRGAAPLETAGPEEIALAGSAKYLKAMDRTGAGAIVVGRDVQYEGKTLIRVDNPPAAFARIASWFHRPARPCHGFHPTAVVGSGFVCGSDTAVASQVSIGDRVRLGDRVTLHPGVVLGDEVVLGDDVELFPNVTVLERCRIGSRVAVHSGTVIGSDGYGFVPEGDGYLKIPHSGIVEIGDDAEIGACNTIDRARFGVTRIGNGVKTDNLVHIAHNVTVGDNTLLVAQVGISGSVTIGRRAILAGQAGVSGHLTIGDGATLGPQTGVARDVAAGQVVSGSPEMPHRRWLRVQRIIAQLPEMKKTLDRLEREAMRTEKPSE